MESQIHAVDNDLSSIMDELYQRIKKGELDIPLLPDIASRVVRLSQEEESTAQSLATLIQSDQTLAAHIIKVANSATYSPTSSIVSLQQAIARLGMNTISEIALATSINASLFYAPGFENEIDNAQINSLASGLWSKEVARACRKNVEAAFLGGLLCDIGRPMVLHTAYEISQIKNIEIKSDAMKMLVNKFSRAMSSRVVKAWNMPSAVQQVIINFNQYHQDHSHQSQTQIAVAGTAIAHHFAAHSNDVDNLKDHPVFADLNLYHDELDTIFEKHEAITLTVEAMRK